MGPGDPNYCLDCDNQPVDEKTLYCETHRVCQVAGCSRSRLTLSPFCALDTCGELGSCGQPALHFEGARFCLAHKCAVTGCQQRRYEASSWCEGHKCAHDDCLEVAFSTSTLCQAHKCFHNTCMREAWKGRDWCHGHACPVLGCFRSKAPMKRSCGSVECKCTVFRCGRLVAICGQRWCVDHTCSAEGCQQRRARSRRSGNEEGYCRLHHSWI